MIDDSPRLTTSKKKSIDQKTTAARSEKRRKRVFTERPRLHVRRRDG